MERQQIFLGDLHGMFRHGCRKELVELIKTYLPSGFRTPTCSYTERASSLYLALVQMDDEGRTPLHVACEENQIQMVKVLCKALPILDNVLPVTFGTQNPSSRILNARDERGRTSTHICCEKGYFKAATKMSKNGHFDCTILTHDSESILHFLARSDKLETDKKSIEDILHILLSRKDSKLKINQQNKNGETALHLACSSSSLWLAKYLISKNAGINILNYRHENALHYTVQSPSRHNLALFNYLIYSGADFTIMGTTSGTVLQVARDNDFELPEEMVGMITKATRTGIQNLAQELLIHIFGFVVQNPKQLLALGQVCTLFRRASEDVKIWIELARSMGKYGFLIEDKLKRTIPSSTTTTPVGSPTYSSPLFYSGKMAVENKKSLCLKHKYRACEDVIKQDFDSSFIPQKNVKSDVMGVRSCKILVLGGCGAGKTTFFQQYKEDKNPIGSYSKLLTYSQINLKVKLTLIDFHDMEGLKSLNRAMCCGINAFIILFDASKAENLNDVILWVRRVNHLTQSKRNRFLVFGTKVEGKVSKGFKAYREYVYKEDKWVRMAKVNNATLARVREKGVTFVEGSARDGGVVNEAMSFLVMQAMEKQVEDKWRREEKKQKEKEEKSKKGWPKSTKSKQQKQKVK